MATFSARSALSATLRSSATSLCIAWICWLALSLMNLTRLHVATKTARMATTTLNYTTRLLLDGISGVIDAVGSCDIVCGRIDIGSENACEALRMVKTIGCGAGCTDI